MDTGIEAVRAARRELDAVIEEIRAVPGHEDFLTAPTFADVAHVASAEHPVVYFAAADPGGLALVVRGEEVSDVALDSLTAETVRTRVSDYLAIYDAFRRAPQPQRPARREEWRSALDEVTAWAWRDVVGPVLRELDDVERTVFVPGGLLGLLPLHAAWTDDVDGGGRRYALDALTITYVPNARALAAARALAGRPARGLVTVSDPPHAPDVAPLPFARIETSIAEHVMPGRSVRIEREAATASRVLDEIAAADVAHLACHGLADLAEPLESGLLLARGEVLRLRDLLALRSKLRLAVLSACETSMPGTELPDEVVALPTGLLQAGVGGVVASLWAVPDLPTTLLMTEFYRRWCHAGEDPPEALRGAQLWVRDTSTVHKARHVVAGIDDGWLPEQAGEALLDALWHGAGDDTHLAAWAGFAYVGA